MMFWHLVHALAIVPGALSLTLHNTACAADNCARAVTGTRAGKVPDVSSRVADCSSFMLATVTPATSTVTTTVTVVAPMKEKRGGNAPLEQRQVTVDPTSVPTYASACSGTVRYSSACSCWGITAMTTTAPTPVATVTVTVTAPYLPCATANTCLTFGYGSACPNAGTCYCVATPEGNTYCAEANIGCAAACSKSSDCQPGYVCDIDDCCGGVCVNAVNCANPVSPSRLFKKADAAADGVAWNIPAGH